MDIRLIEDKDFIDLVDLNAKMYSEIDPSINAFQATNTLIAMVNSNSFAAIGMYDGKILMGFVSGYRVNDVFYFSGIYSIERGIDVIQKLIEYSFEYVEKIGCKAWEADATNNNISSILEKYGAEVKYKRYRKELM